MKNNSKKNRKMSEKTKFNLALKAHSRLEDYYTTKYCNNHFEFKDVRLASYHGCVWSKMQELNRRLSQNEKKEIFERITREHNKYGW